MADALSHQCLLHFAADFGISGALLSTLEVGEIYLSCDGEGLMKHRLIFLARPLTNFCCHVSVQVSFVEM